MENKGRPHGPKGLEEHGIKNVGTIWWNLSTGALCEQALQRREGIMAHLGPLVVYTGKFTGRAPKDRFIVRQPPTEENISWGAVNLPIEPEAYTRLRAKVMAYLQHRDLFVQECYVGTDPEYRLPIRVITETAWHSWFARNMFVVELDPEELARHQAEYTIINACGFHADPERDGTRSEAFVLLDMERKEVLIGGTAYAGENKKAMFTIMNYLLPDRGVLPMHCSATWGEDEDDVAVLFGLSGTGKTTLSADPERTLIGDDEHGWSDRGVFNFEGGCYAKAIRLTPEGEPEIYETTQMFGTLLENVAIDLETRHIDLDSDIITENTRASYPIHQIPNASSTGMAGHPKNILMLTADAFGVMPPIAKLTPEQAMYHFLSGYTAKVAGTERGVTEPSATFSTCFGAPFMPRSPVIYARLLGERIAKHEVDVWLVNTGWTGGPYGTGHRMELAHTRAMVRAALNGTLAGAEFLPDPVFGLAVPKACPDVPDEVLQPRSTWADTSAYDQQAKKLAEMFRDNFKQFEDDVSEDVRAAGPRPDAAL